MLQIAEELAFRGGHSPFFLFTGDNFGSAINHCEKRGIQYAYYDISQTKIIDSSQEDRISADAKTIDSRWVVITNWIKSRLKSSFAVMFAFYLIQFLNNRRFASGFLSQNKTDCIILIGDRHAGIETALVREGNLRGIPSLIVPFGFADEESSVVYRQALDNWKKTYGMETFLNRMIASIKPDWTYTHNAETLLWNPPSWLISASITGLIPHNPWTLGGGYAWRMAVESQYHKDSFCKQGVPREKIFVSGKPRYDRSARVWENKKLERRKIYNRFDFDDNKPLLICSVPQMAEHDLLSWSDHWDEVDFLFSSLAEQKSRVNVVLLLHPKSDYSQYLSRADQYSLQIAREYSYDQLIPVCDAFLATFSSTVTLAIACHIPVIVIDFFGLGYDFFDDMAGIAVCRQHEEMVATLYRLFSDDDYFQQMVNGQRLAADYWARFDGKSTERILDEIDKLIERGKEIQKLPKRKRRRKLPLWLQ